MDEQSEGKSPEAEEDAVQNQCSRWGARGASVDGEEDDSCSGRGGDEEVLGLLVFGVGECDTWGAHNNEGPGNGHATATKLIDEVEHDAEDDDGGEELDALEDVEGETAVVGWFAVGVPPGGGEWDFGPLHFGGWL